MSESKVPSQEEIVLATVQGKEVTSLPEDLYVPPNSLKIFLDSFAGPLDLLLYLIRKQNLDILDIIIIIDFILEEIFDINGDMNFDGGLNIQDIVLILNFILGR